MNGCGTALGNLVYLNISINPDFLVIRLQTGHLLQAASPSVFNKRNMSRFINNWENFTACFEDMAQQGNSWCRFGPGLNVRHFHTLQNSFWKFPLTPMGVLLHRLRTLDSSLVLPFGILRQL